MSSDPLFDYRRETGIAVAQRYVSPDRDVLDSLAAVRPARTSRSGKLPSGSNEFTSADCPTTGVRNAGDIGRRVREARKSMGMTQQRFADLAGVGRRFLVELEQGKSSLEIGRVLAVCQAAGLKLHLC